MLVDFTIRQDLPPRISSAMFRGLLKSMEGIVWTESVDERL